MVKRLPHLHIVHVELANAYLRAGRIDEAESALNRAEELNFPVNAVIFNQRACIAFARGNVGNAIALLEQADQTFPNQIVLENLKKLRPMTDIEANDRRRPPILNDSVDVIDFCTPIDSFFIPEKTADT